MLVLRNYNYENKKELKKLLIEEGIEDLELDGIIYIVLDNDLLIGASKVTEECNKWILQYIVIKDEFRGQKLGDGLLRAVLNKIVNQGIKEVFFKSTDPFLINRGFIQTNNNEIKLDLENFFNKECKGCEKLNEL